MTRGTRTPEEAANFSLTLDHLWAAGRHFIMPSNQPDNEIMPAAQRMRFAIVGRSGAGKSEVARIISAHTLVPIIKTGLVCRQISNIIFGNDSKTSTQILDDALTQIDSSIFLRAAIRNAGDIDQFILDSLRFASDEQIARELSCKIIRVVAVDELRIERLRSRGQEFDIAINGTHRSEIELDEIVPSIEISNNGNIEDLTNNVLLAIDRTK